RSRRPAVRRHLASPGGFVDKGERPYMTALRELVEETSFRLTVGRTRIIGLDGILRHIERAYVGSFRKEGPDRDPRAHINTTTFVFDLDRIGVIDRPGVKLADDARDVGWKDFAEILSLDTYADHEQIVAQA
ncbi:NUDIX hydrolase domain-like protein, partial [Tribonema minus]